MWLNILFASLLAGLLILIFLLLSDIAQSLRNIGQLFSDILIGAPDAQEIDYNADNSEREGAYEGDDIEQYLENAVENPYPGRQQMHYDPGQAAGDKTIAFSLVGISPARRVALKHLGAQVIESADEGAWRNLARNP